MAASKGEARRLIVQGGVKLNEQPVQWHREGFGGDMDGQGRRRLAVGKKRHGLIKGG